MNKSNREQGSVLLAVMLIVMVAVALVGAAHIATSNQVRQTSRSSIDAELESTGEGVLDYAYGQWKSSMDSNGMLNATAATALVNGSNLPAVPSNMAITNLSIVPVDAYGTPTSDGAWQQNNDYKMSFVCTYVASVTLQATGLGAGYKGIRTVTMNRSLVYTAVPPTRGMFFSEGDFELYKPATMVIGGDVHTNGNAHVSTGTQGGLTFLPTSTVSYVGSYDNGIPAGAASWNNTGANYPPTYQNGASSQVKKVPDIQGIGIGTAAEYDTTDNNPNNDGNRELIEPPVSGFSDPPAIASSRIYNNAGILINISGPVDTTASLTQTTGTNSSTFAGGNISITTQNGTTLTAAQATTIRNAVSNSVTTQVQTWVPNLVQVTQQVWVSSGYYTTVRGRKTWVDTSGYQNQTTTVDEGHYVTTNVVSQKTLYDKREVQSIPISDINVGAITPTLNAASGFNGILYVYDTGTSDEKAIRVTNGGTLPDNGLTIATEDGLYVQGDYNTGTTTNPNQVPSNANPATNASTTVPGYTTKSAALVGDAIMVLSNNWSDSNASSSVNSRVASNTTLNTALISGYVASTSDGNNGRSGYSGGMNNFPRFLENWSNRNMTFSGAFVSLYESKQFTGSWDTGDIYSPPTRYWYFDTMLLSRVLPGIPPSGGCVKGPMSVL